MNPTTGWRDRIVCSADLHHGEPCIRGTRVSVAVIVGSLAEMPVAEVIAQFPQLTEDDVRAALYFAAEAAHTSLVA